MICDSFVSPGVWTSPNGQWSERLAKALRSLRRRSPENSQKNFWAFCEMFPSSSNFEPRPSIFPQNKATQGKKLISIFLGFLGRCTVFFLLVCFFVLFRSTLFLNKILLNSLQPRRGLITFFPLGFAFFFLGIRQCQFGRVPKIMQVLFLWFVPRGFFRWCFVLKDKENAKFILFVAEFGVLCVFFPGLFQLSAVTGVFFWFSGWILLG